MNIENIKKELSSLITTLFADNGFDVEMIEYVDFVDDFGMDSITFISLIVEIESRFNIQIPDDYLLIEKFKDLNSIAKIIAEQIAVTKE